MEQRVSFGIAEPAKWILERIDWLAILALGALYLAQKKARMVTGSITVSMRNGSRF